MRVPIQERVPCGHHSERERYPGFALSVANDRERNFVPRSRPVGPPTLTSFVIRSAPRAHMLASVAVGAPREPDAQPVRRPTSRHAWGTTACAMSATPHGMRRTHRRPHYTHTHYTHHTAYTPHHHPTDHKHTLLTVLSTSTPRHVLSASIVTRRSAHRSLRRKTP